MVRSSQQLHAWREPAATRPAATVLLLRDGAQGLEVLMTRRSLTASFAPGAYVFPGGGIDASDAATWQQARQRPGQPAQQGVEAIAAIRESFEELGVLLAWRADGSMANASDLARLDRSQPLPAQCQALGLTLAADQVFVLARWTTDRDLPRRFEVPFLVARMPDGQTPVADETEQFEPVWVRPADALERHAAGSFFIIFPTIRTLERLRGYASVQGVLDACASGQPLWQSCPRAGLLAGHEARYMEHEAAFGELALVCPDGQMLHHLDWQHEQPVSLLRNVMRLTAGNPGVMTGPGTNTYIVGDADSGYIVIDPGPDEPEHLERIRRATGGQIRLIVCTHSHADHSPGAAPLKAMCHGVPTILGLPSQDTAGAHAFFRPDASLAHGQLLSLQGAAGVTHTLQVIHTPGHAANHLCLLLQEDGLLFSGDHILNGSTTVVNPPDGEMTAYLDSLDLLDRECERHGAEFILPAHGYVLGSARLAIAQLKAHRLKREAKVLAAMQARPEGSMDDWVALAYDDVHPRLWPVAARSLLAHVQRLQALNG